jgi:hydrogenase maturation protease
MQVPAVFAAVRAMGGTIPRVLVVGCEPASCEGPGLSEPVGAAVDGAVGLVQELLRRERPPAPQVAR